MLESTTNAFLRESYTVDLSGLIAHARDIVAMRVARQADDLREAGADLPRSRVGPRSRSHAEFGVPDSVNVR